MEILKALQEGKTVVVCNVWYFSNTTMVCAEGPGCCSSNYSSLAETAEEVMEYASGDFDCVEIQDR